MIQTFLDILLHLDTHLDAVIRQYGVGTYILLFAVIFAETGLIATPFLPGDSLLFAAGTFAARGLLDLLILLAVLAGAAIAGDTVNYWIGNAVGPRVFRAEGARLFKREYLDRTHRFYEKYGGITIVLARFVPIIRTFAPFVAGIGRMAYGRFLLYNVLGGTLWVVLFVVTGYVFGNIPVVRRNFTLVILAIIVVSILPSVVELLRRRRDQTASRSRR